MPRHHRIDAKGMYHHVFNRGIARRTVFETRRDVRVFLFLLVREVRAKRIELCNYAVLTTHFHLLIQSVTGELDGVMQRVVNTYVRYFNRGRRRDGPLFRGRYESRPVDSVQYHAILVNYIDRNAPEARLATASARYPYGSAFHYCADRRPRWLSTRWADEWMGDPGPENRAPRYVACFGSETLTDLHSLVEARARRHSATGDDLDDLIGMAPDRVVDWMRRKALLADGTRPGLVHASSSRVTSCVDAAQQDFGEWKLVLGALQQRTAWPVLRAGLLRQMACLTFVEIAAQVGCSPGEASRRVKQHTQMLESSAEYRQMMARIVPGCLPSQNA